MHHDLPPQVSARRDLPAGKPVSGNGGVGHSASRNPRSLTPLKLAGYSTSIVITLTVLGWVVGQSMSVLDQNLPVEAKDVSHRGSVAADPGSLSRAERIEHLQEKAREIDAQLMRDRSYRRREELAERERGAREVHYAWKQRVQKLEAQLAQFPSAEPGTIAFDINKRLEELKADAPLSEYELRQLQD